MLKPFILAASLLAAASAGAAEPVLTIDEPFVSGDETTIDYLAEDPDLERSTPDPVPEKKGGK